MIAVVFLGVCFGKRSFAEAKEIRNAIDEKTIIFLRNTLIDHTPADHSFSCSTQFVYERHFRIDDPSHGKHRRAVWKACRIKINSWSINVGPMPFHVPLRPRQWTKSKLFIESMRIARDQYESPQALKIRVDDDRLHQPAR